MRSKREPTNKAYLRQVIKRRDETILALRDQMYQMRLDDEKLQAYLKQESTPNVCQVQVKLVSGVGLMAWLPYDFTEIGRWIGNSVLPMLQDSQDYIMDLKVSRYGK